MATKGIAFYAIIGKQGEPIYMENFLGEAYEIDLEFAAYSALDYIDEKYSRPMSNDMYLGLLYSIFIGSSELNIYAYMTNVQTKYILFKNVGDIFKSKEDDAAIRKTFEKINESYLEACMNPFLNGKLGDKGSPLVKKFAQRVKDKCFLAA